MVGVIIAFKKFSPVYGIFDSPWVGLKNFTKFFNSHWFERTVTNTMSLSFYTLLAGFPIPIILALSLNVLRKDKFKRFVQTVTYMPHFISVVVLVGMLSQLFNPIIGLYGNISRIFTGETPRDILGLANVFPHMYVWSGIWQQMGWNSIIYIAALSAVDPELHEAAEIDGASRFKRVRHIDLPTILPTITILLILQAGRIMNVGFQKVFLMQNSLNLKTSEVISTYVYRIGLGSGGNSDFSYAAAIGLFNSFINLLLIITVNWISRKLSETSLW
jgi:putative aldouronate transport system permease protein